MRENKQRRWLLALIIIAAVIIASVCIALSYRDKPGSIPMSAISDGSGGAIIAWQEEEGIYVQHIDASGKPLWQKGGLLVTEAGAKLDPYTQSRTSFSLIADGSGGAIITWDERYKMPTDRNDPAFFNPIPFHSQRISSTGEFLWNDTELAIGSAGLYGGNFPMVVNDGTGGAIFAWNSYTTAHRALHNDFLRLQKLTPDGTRLWGDEGKLLVSSSPYRPLNDEEKAAGFKGTISRSRPTYAGTHDIVSDGSEGCIVIWEEEGEKNSYYVYAQRLDIGGNPAWKEKVTVGSSSYQYHSLSSDGSGGAYLALTGRYTGTVYQQHIGSNGELLEKTEYSTDTIGDGLGGSIRVRVEVDPPSGPPNQKRNILYVQRFDSLGSPLWPEKQVLATLEHYQLGNLKYTGDGKGGVILTWQLEKEFTAYGGTLAQRIDAEGHLLWGDEGLFVFNASQRYRGNAIILNDDSGGFLVAAVAGNNALGGDMVYLQHLDSAGNRLWGDGIQIDR